MSAAPDDYEDDHDDDHDCPNCGGEGYVWDCIEQYACIDPEGGCDLCTVRCDWCAAALNPPSAEGREP